MIAEEHFTQLEIEPAREWARNASLAADGQRGAMSVPADERRKEE